MTDFDSGELADRDTDEGLFTNDDVIGDYIDDDEWTHETTRSGVTTKNLLTSNVTITETTTSEQL